MRKVNKDTRGNNPKVKNSQGSNKSRHQTPNRRLETQEGARWLGYGVGSWPGSVGDLGWPYWAGSRVSEAIH